MCVTCNMPIHTHIHTGILHKRSDPCSRMNQPYLDKGSQTYAHHHCTQPLQVLSLPLGNLEYQDLAVGTAGGAWGRGWEGQEGR